MIDCRILLSFFVSFFVVRLPAVLCYFLPCPFTSEVYRDPFLSLSLSTFSSSSFSFCFFSPFVVRRSPFVVRVFFVVVVVLLSFGCRVAVGCLLACRPLVVVV